MTSSIETLVQEHAPLVRRIALRFVAKLPASIDVNDLIQAGMIGLLDAAKRYQKGLGAQFTSYATTRINGAILDELRSMDWAPRESRRIGREIEKAIRSVEQALGRAASEGEIAQKLGVSTNAYAQMLTDAHATHLLYYEDCRPSEDDGASDNSIGHLLSIKDQCFNPLELLLDQEFKNELSRAIDRLPEKEKLVLSLTYVEELNQKEIAVVMGYTVGRISQLRTQGTARLRASMGLAERPKKPRQVRPLRVKDPRPND